MRTQRSSLPLLALLLALVLAAGSVQAADDASLMAQLRPVLAQCDVAVRHGVASAPVPPAMAPDTWPADAKGQPAGAACMRGPACGLN